MDGISIVIICRGREQLLEELLQSVQKARERVEFPTEVVLVDSSQGDSIPVVEGLSKTYDTSYYYQDISVSAKRNYGVEHSRYDTVLFLDSDCLATPDILRHYADAYASHPDAGGAAGPLEFVGPDTWFWKVVTKTPYTIFFQAARWGETVQWAPTANFSVRKAAFLDAGGFDVNFQKNPGGEDVDLGLRMRQKGYTIYTAKEALVYHSKATWSPVKAMFRRCYNYGAGDAHLCSRYGHMTCDALPGRLTFMLLGMILYLILGILKNPWFLLGIPLFPVAEIVMTAVSANLFYPYKRCGLLKQCTVQLLLLRWEAGYKSECLRMKRRDLLRKQLVHFQPQMNGICLQNFHASIIAAILAGVTFVLLMAV